MKGMVTCKVCGRDFPLLAEEHYVAQDPQKVGAIANLVSTDRAFEFDTFDCPHCGCQNVMQERKPILWETDDCPCDYGICDECDHVGEDKESDLLPSTCDNCKYSNKTEHEEPCIKCKYNHVSFFEPKEESHE